MKIKKQSILISAVLAGVVGISSNASASVPFCKIGDLVYSTIINVEHGKAEESRFEVFQR